MQPEGDANWDSCYQAKTTVLPLTTAYMHIYIYTSIHICGQASTLGNDKEVIVTSTVLGTMFKCSKKKGSECSQRLQMTPNDPNKVLLVSSSEDDVFGRFLWSSVGNVTPDSV